MAQAIRKIKECFFPQTNNHCLWYRDCLDMVYQCGTMGFPKGYAFITCSMAFYTGSFGEKSMKCHELELLPYMIGAKFPAMHHRLKAPCAALEAHGIDLYLKCFIKHGFCKKAKITGTGMPGNPAFVAMVTAWVKAGEIASGYKWRFMKQEALADMLNPMNEGHGPELHIVNDTVNVCKSMSVIRMF